MEKFSNVTNPDQHRETELKKLEQDLNEIIPILAHGLVRRLEQKGLGGKVRVQSFAGDSWGIAKSPDNVTDIPNVIIYPREALQGDKHMLNALLRHEIGNLNYPIEPEINTLQDWCKTNNIAPQLLTALVESVHEASVNYLEMRNSHSDSPQENFKALYETEINTEEIAQGISKSSPYKQAIDLTLLYSLAYSGLIPNDRFEQALASASAEVQKTFEHQTKSILEQAVNTAVPHKQVQLIRDFVWPKFSHLVSAGDQESLSKKSSFSNEEYQELLKQVKEMKDKLKENKKENKKSENKEKGKNKKEAPKKKPESKEEQQEKKDAKEDLDKTLKESLEDLKEQLKELSKDVKEKEEKDQSSKEESLSEQAKEAKEDAEKASEKSQDEKTKEKIEKLKEELKQLEELAKQLEEGAPENIEDEPIVYNIKEFGIDESLLTSEQLDSLQKVRDFAMQTSVTYRKAMRFVMKAYQRHNQNFTNEIIQKMMDRGYDVPDFSIYGAESAQEFFNTNAELGITEYSQNFLVNFNLPKPLGRFWYKGGNGAKSVPVPEGAVEWGHFYRTTMPAIWNSVDKAAMSGLHLNRINEFGQHDPLNYYYLWEAVNFNQQDQDNEDGEGEEGGKGDESSEKGEGEKGDSEGGEDGEKGEGSGGEGGQGEGKEEESGDGTGEGDGDVDSEGNGEGQGEGKGGKSSQRGEGNPSDLLSDAEGILSESLESGKISELDFNELKEKLNDLLSKIKDGGEIDGSFSKIEDLLKQIEKSSNGKFDENGYLKMDVGEKNELKSQESVGGAGNDVEGEGLKFNLIDEKLLKELLDSKEKLASKFAENTANGQIKNKDLSEAVKKFLDSDTQKAIDDRHKQQLNNLEQIKSEQEKKLESFYKEMSGLDGVALKNYITYMEATKNLTEDLTDFFVEKFDLDKDYILEKNQKRGARLQRGFTRNILGKNPEGNLVVSPKSFERKREPEMPQFVWTIILDNTGSVGAMIEDEKKLAVSLMEVTKRLDIPFEVVVYTEGGYQFLKTFENESYGDDLKKIVLLDASIGNQQDTDLLNAAYNSQIRFSEKYKRSHNFIFFITDGLACSQDSLNAMVSKFKKETLIVGVGLGQGAQTISNEFGKNAIAIEDSNQLSAKFIRKVEDLIDQTFD